MESILTSVKKLLGIAEECEDFDADVVMYINSALFALTQMGVGPGSGFYITGKEETWEQFIPDPVKAAAAKAYVAVKVRLLGFDVPQSSTTMEALKNTATEMEWRLNAEFDYPAAESTDAKAAAEEALGMQVQNGRLTVTRTNEDTGVSTSEPIATDSSGKAIAAQLSRIAEKNKG